MSKLKVAVVGAGYFAEKHLEVLKAFADVEIAALCNNGNPRINALAQKFEIKNISNEYQKILDAGDIDAVFVLVNAPRIAEVAGECLRRGIPTLLEKPPGLSVGEARGLVEIADRTKCINMVGLNRRFYSVMQRAREAVQEVGPLVSVVIEAPERLWEFKTLNHPPEVIDGLLYANSIHCIDLLRYFGGDLKEIHAMNGQWNEDQKNSFGALVRFESGAIGQYISNWTTPGGWSVTLYGMNRRVTLKPLEHGVVVDVGGAESVLPVDEVDVQFKPGLYAQNRFFIDGVRENRRPSYPAADLADALKTMELIAAIEDGVAERTG
jgi:predicted dehydrogenase